MKNLDLIQSEKTKIMQKMSTALKDDDTAGFAQAWEDLQENLQEAVMAQARGMVAQVDNNVLAMRGARQLTSGEFAYYEGLIQAMKAGNPQQAIAEYTPVLPKTTIDEVFLGLVKEHPLLEAINFQNTSGLVEFIVNSNTKQMATWGNLTGAVAQELASGFKKVDMKLNKLSAFMPIAKSMLDLGPAWLDVYVRKVLSEALAFGTEEAIINGTGKDQPIGMNKQVGEGITVTGGVYPLKEAIPLTSFKPSVYGEFLATLTKDANGNPRPIKEVLFVCNPVDYLKKVMPATTMLKPDGTYIGNVTPIATKFIQSMQVPQGKAIVGLADRYFMALGTAKDGKVEYSDEYKFLQDERTYLIKLYGHGTPLDNNAFIYADISALLPLNVTVEIDGQA